MSTVGIALSGGGKLGGARFDNQNSLSSRQGVHLCLPKSPSPRNQSGITGIVAGLSTFNSFVTRVYDASSKPNLIASTVSGGTIGFGIHANAGSKLTYQLYDSGISYDVANSEVKEDGEIWYANVVNYLNWAPFLTGEASERKTTMTGAMQSGWWTDVIDLMFWEGYSIHDYDITGSDLYNWHANFALLDKVVCPISRNDDGVMKKAEEGLVYAR